MLAVPRASTDTVDEAQKKLFGSFFVMESTALAAPPLSEPSMPAILAERAAGAAAGGFPPLSPPPPPPSFGSAISGRVSVKESLKAAGTSKGLVSLTVSICGW